ncbi:hypothetical protein [Streptomyces chartreusis]|uniref:hypothetical protein n=1 Tax=Streptomyces chartreusis TaxID=1969 RepID=UPI00367A48FA
MSKWHIENEHVWNNENWGENFQGITAGTDYWYFTCNSDSQHEGIWRLNHDFTEPVRVAKSPMSNHHLGALTFNQTNRRIFVALEPAKVWEYSAASSTTIRISTLGGNGSKPQGDSMPWCAINPTDGLLYSSAFGDEGEKISWVNKVHAYDPAQNFKLVRTVSLPHTLRRIQGGCFSPLGGHLYLSSDWSKAVLGYNIPPVGISDVATHLGNCAINAPDIEVEGLTIGYPKNYAVEAGNHMWVHVSCLDDDWPDGDDVYLKHIWVPDAMSV